MQLFTSKTSAWKFTCSFHFRDKRTISLILYRKLFQRFVLYDTACWVRVTIRPMALPVLLSIFQHQRTVHVVLHIPRHMYILRTHTHTHAHRDTYCGQERNFHLLSWYFTRTHEHEDRCLQTHTCSMRHT